MDVTFLIMRVDNNLWSANDIVNLWFGLDKDPSASVTINPKHAVLILRNVPITREQYPRFENFLTQASWQFDVTENGNLIDKRRHQLVRSELPVLVQRDIANDGRAEIEWDDFFPKVRRKARLTEPERRLNVVDF